ncbi:PREDICTED: probable cysteine--tRNA ligase, mitochondrial, partial [Priapulus caudatus]|uniref:Probable cysteine--tRNA ligase, mitochondrial n=1 Tax=Priapulus caudatus TaxID=37621 RepID=A0ABM1F4Z1_PRICU
ARTAARNSGSIQRQCVPFPRGHDTGVVVFNSQTRTKTPLVLPHGRIATWYQCGPTVYEDPHLGHALCYVRSDILRRLLEEFFGIDVVMVMGVTDVNDKVFDRARELGVDYQHVAKTCEARFFDDMAKVKVLPPTVVTRVSEHIPQVVAFVSRLVDRGFAYKTPRGSVYFDVSRYGRYGKLMTHSVEAEVRESHDPEKKHPRDFALWKAAKPGEPTWRSPWSAGRPGWHIECSTMASEVFGRKLDIHTGGIDLVS